MDYTQGIGATILKNRLNCLKYKDVFFKVFKKWFTPYWEGNIIGFDILKFDKDIGTPDDMSTADFVLQEYGQEGLDIINGLLS